MHSFSDLILASSSLLNHNTDTDRERMSCEEHDSEPDSSSDSEGSLLRTPYPGVSEGLAYEYDVIQGYYDAVISIVDKLFDVSILIRGTTSNFRTSRAAVHVEKDLALEGFKRMVYLKIKGLCPKTPEWLVKRLTGAIGMRRQQFYYQRAHRYRLSADSTLFKEEALLVSKHVAARTIESVPTSATKHELSPVKPLLSASQMAKSIPTVTTGGTSATDPVLDDEQETGCILNKPAPSEMGIGENSLPPPPKEPQGKAFECNQCFHILPDKTRKKALWRFATTNS